MVLANLPDDLIELKDVGGLLPGNPSSDVVLRWVEEGVRGPSRKRVRLESVRVGSKRWISRAALDRFLSALNEPIPVAAK